MCFCYSLCAVFYDQHCSVIILIEEKCWFWTFAKISKNLKNTWVLISLQYNNIVSEGILSFLYMNSAPFFQFPTFTNVPVYKRHGTQFLVIHKKL